VTLETITDDGVVAACLFAIIGNGNTVAQTSVTAVAVGIAGSALLLSGVSAVGPHAGFHGVHFVDVMHWFNFIAYSGMYSVNYPPIYRSFAKNFGWSTGLVTWQGMQDSIDNFRAKTGGNLTDDNQQYLKNSTLVYDSSKMRKRDEVASIGNNITGGTDHFVSGVAAFAESLDIPSAKYSPHGCKFNIQYIYDSLIHLLDCPWRNRNWNDALQTHSRTLVTLRNAFPSHGSNP
jgi:Transient receptor potential (TRP) ion channel